MFLKFFTVALLVEFALISVALFRIVAATVSLRIAVDDVLGKLSETEAEMRQLREDLGEPKTNPKSFRRERQTVEL
ncbi:MAG: hypothetical protein M3X11_15500 [Acidobacteriota bacterium]|nr:hypothetical protein [Acidobacteriota bacterium]